MKSTESIIRSISDVPGRLLLDTNIILELILQRSMHEVVAHLISSRVVFAASTTWLELSEIFLSDITNSRTNPKNKEILGTVGPNSVKSLLRKGPDVNESELSFMYRCCRSAIVDSRKIYKLEKLSAEEINDIITARTDSMRAVTQYNIRTVPVFHRDVIKTLEVARKIKNETRDASIVNIAIRKKLTILTEDRNLHNQCKKEIPPHGGRGVPVSILLSGIRLD